uniref:THAP-type domain-containing protein n=1 Tax=Glossina brevipalpis TaxID=37001 RepID=A0A1A9WKB2_9MUSC
MLYIHYNRDPLNFPRRKVQTERSLTLPICQRCKQVFLKRQNYAHHVALSVCDIVEYDLKCSICPMSFMSNEELNSHEHLHRSNHYFCQKYCGKHYETILECEQHEYTQHDYESYKCNICLLEFPLREELLQHLPLHKFQIRFVCSVCREWFQILAELHEHCVAAPNLCGKFYNKDALNKSQKHDSSHSQLSKVRNSLSYNKIPSETSTQEDSQSNSASRSFIISPDEQEVKTEIKVEPDFYPPLEQGDFDRFDGDYNSENFSSTSSISNQNLNFLHDFQDNASSSTNSSYNMPPASNEAVGGDEDAVCCVRLCGVSKFRSPTLQFFGFPRDNKYLQQWLHNLKMPYDHQANYTQYRICSLHFPKRCMNRYSLSYWAVPTFNLGHDDVANIYQNREISNNIAIGEMSQCYMPGCRSQRGESNVKFYNFPKDLKTLIKWCQNARLPVHAKEPRHFCSRHFEEKCFGKFRLKPWAIPTLHLGTVYGKIHDNPNVSYLEEKKCCLPFCRKSRSDDFNLSLYRFPRDETLLRKWCYNLRLHPDVYRGKNQKICSHHFIKEALGLRKLSPGAVPTLNLGHSDRVNIYENELLSAPINPAPNSFVKMSKYHHSSHSSSSSSIYDEVFTNNCSSSSAKFTSSSTPNSNALDLGDMCLVPSCKNTRHTENITLHTIPRRPEQLKKWCHNLKMNLEKHHKSIRICSAHFESYCIGGCMRPFAVPTLELGHDDPNIYRNPDVIKKLNIRETCCVPCCKRNRDRDHANLHRFPTNPELLQKWCENLQKPVPDGTKLFNDAVCEVHFEDKCLRNKRLEKWAIPTLKLGYEPVVYQLPSEQEIMEFWSKPPAPNNGDELGECCVSTCKRNPQVDDVRLYRPPEDAEQLVKWSHNLQIEVTELSSLKICNLHFEAHCIGKRLLNWAMPTLNLASSVEHLFENPPPTSSNYKRKVKIECQKPQEFTKWSPRCCLSHCRKTRSHDQVQLYRFPVNIHTLTKWCHNLQLPTVGSSHRRICSAHFEAAVLTKRCPIAFAVPTLDLNTPLGYKIYQNSPKLKQHRIINQRCCVVNTCRKTRSDGVQLFRFPNNRVMLNKWRHNLKHLPKGKLSSQFRICSLHFEKHSVGLKRLSPGAIPTLNLGHDSSEDLYPNETRSFFELDKCVVTGCSSSKDMENVRLFKFPREDEELLGKWCHNLKMNTSECLGIRICNKHFETECMGPKLLYKWSIPTLKLGYDENEPLEIIPNPPPEKRTGDVLFKCCVSSCGKTRKYDEAQMNSFPKNIKMFRRWKHNLKLDYLNFKEREKFKICNDHFEAICVGKTRLNFGAIPTLNLGHDDMDDLYKINPDKVKPNLFIKQSTYEEDPLEIGYPNDNIAEEDIEEQMESSILPMDISNLKCAYYECIGPKCLLREPYSLPQTEVFRKMWFSLMSVQDSFAGGESKLCGLHYQKVFENCEEEMLSLMTENEELKADFEKLQNAYHKSEISLIIKSCKCSSRDCTNSLILPHIRLYQFPYGKELKEKWSYNTGIEPDEHRRYLNKVCCIHFESYCFTSNQRLRSWAIPTLELKHLEADTLYKNPDLTKIDRRLLGPHIMKCCVRDCNGENSVIEGESLKLFSFPLDEDLLTKWCENLKMCPQQTPIFKICSLHFERQCYGLTRLRIGAVPTVNLGHSDEPRHCIPNNIKKDVYDIESSPSHSGLGLKQVKIKKSLGSVKCFIPSCRRTRLQHGVRFYTLPSNSKLRRKWCHNLRLSLNLGKLHSLRICSLHFHKKCLDGRNLKPWAVPTLYLGHQEAIFDNPRTLRGQYVPQCVLLHCRHQKISNKNMRFFAFPKTPDLLEKWCKNLRLSIDQCNGYLCERHFEIEVMGLKKLKKGTVPTLNLGHFESLEFDNLNLIEEMKYPNLIDTDGEDNDDDLDCFYGEFKESAEFDLESESLRTPTNWSNLEVKELRITLTPLKQEDLAEIMSVASPLEIEEEENYQTCIESREDDTSEQRQILRKDKAVNNFNPICCLKHCGKEKTPEQHLTTFGFPKDRDLLQKWCDNLGLEPSACIGRVCVDHFELRVMGNRRLKPGAVPTLNLGHNKPLKHTNEPIKTKIIHDEFKFIENNEEEKQANQIIKPAPPPYKTKPAKQSVFRLCCLKHCRRKRMQEKIGATTLTFKIPQDLKRLKQWSALLKLPEEVCRRPTMRLCAKHFESHMINEEKAQLKPNAIPTLNLGYELVNKLESGTETLDIEKCDLKHCGRIADNDDVFLLSFPFKPLVLLRKWCYNTRISYKTKNLKFLKICNDHFDKNVFMKKKCLRFNAVPTLNLGHTGKIYKNPKSYRLKTSLKPKEKCCVINCQEEQEKMYGFPKNSELRRIWSNNLRIETRVALKQQSKVCQRHFTSESFINGTDSLKIEAIPTLQLGGDKDHHLVLEMDAMTQGSPPQCMIRNCGCIPSVDKVKLFNFPQSTEVLEKWLFNLQLTQNYAIENTYICSRHFEKSCIRRGILHEMAIPTLCLGHAGCFYGNEEEMFTTPIKCCVTSCNYNPAEDESEILRSMYRFPKDSENLKKWLENLNISDNIFQKQKSIRICGHHFEEVCKLKGRETLVPNSVPTMNLGYDSKVKNIHRNHFEKCCLQSCKMREKFAVNLHDLPQDLNIRSLWFEELALEDRINTENFICSPHFMAIFERLKEKHKIYLKQYSEYGLLSALYKDLKLLDLMQGFKCSIPKCSTGFKMTAKLFKFPNDVNLFNKWQHNTGLQFEMNKRCLHQICALHFEPRCLSEVKLHRWALPTLKLPNLYSLYVNPPEALPSDHENLKHCCVSDCISEEMPFFQFPSKQINLKKWMHNLDLGAQQCTTNLRVCFKHFEKYCFKKEIGKKQINLKSWSIPTLRLKDKLDLYQNPIEKISFFVCCITTCRKVRNTSEGIYFYKFPRSKTLSKKWLYNAGIAIESFHERMRICSLHFTSDCFVKDCMILRKHTVPTLNLSTPIELMHKNPPKKKLSSVSVAQHYCLVKSCNVMELKNKELYELPKNKIMLSKWWHNLNLGEYNEGLLLADVNKKICRKHFSDECFDKKGELKVKSIPTLNLGHDKEIFQNSDELNAGKLLLQNAIIKVENGSKLKKGMNLKGGSHLKGSHLKASNAEKYVQDGDVKSSNRLFKKTIKNTKSHLIMMPTGQNKIKRIQKVYTKKKSKQLIHKYERYHRDQFEGGGTTTHVIRKNIKSEITLAPPALILKTTRTAANHVVKCSIQNCLELEKDPKLQLFSYPRKIDLLQKWLHQTTIGENIKNRLLLWKKYKICSSHFENQCFQDQRLLYGAIPTINLINKNIKENLCTENLKAYESQRCFVKKCGRSEEYDQIIKCYFPKEKDLLEKWFFNLNITEEEIVGRTWLCHMHFEQRRLKQGKLLPDTVPTLLLDYEPSNKIGFFKNPEICSTSTTSQRKEMLLSTCCVKDCQNAKGGGGNLSAVQFSKFPKQSQILQKWLHNLKIIDSNEVRQYYRVCSLHFELKCFNRFSLKFGSIPTRNLGHQDPDMYEILDEELHNNQIKKSKFYNKKCSYPYCKGNKTKLYDLPQFKLVLEKWWQTMQLSTFNERDQAKVCDIHFYMLYNEHYEIIKIMEEQHPDSAKELIKLYNSIAARGKVIRHRCAVFDCNTDHLNGSNSDIKLYNFPTDSGRAKKWCFNCHLDYEGKIKDDHDHNYKVCALHFEDYCINDIKLQPWAVPTLQLKSSSSSSQFGIYSNDTIMDDTISDIEICCIETCINSQGLKTTNTCLYNFPQERDLLDKWLKCINLKVFDFHKTRICGLHFAEKFLSEDKQLLPLALPTLNLDLIIDTSNKSHENTYSTHSKLPHIETAVTVKQELENWDDWLPTEPFNTPIHETSSNKIENNNANDSYFHEPPPQCEIITVKEEIIDVDYDIKPEICSGFELNNEKHFLKPRIVACYSQNLRVHDFTKKELNLEELQSENHTEMKLKILNSSQYSQNFIENSLNDNKREMSFQTIKLPFKVSIPSTLNRKCESLVNKEEVVSQSSVNNLQNFLQKSNLRKIHEDLQNKVCNKISSDFSVTKHIKEEIFPQPNNRDNMMVQDNKLIKKILGKKFTSLGPPTTDNNNFGNNRQNFKYRNFIENSSIVEHVSSSSTETIDSVDRKTFLTSSIVAASVSSKVSFQACCVAKCLNTTETSLVKIFTEFPSDSELFIKWCFNLKIDPRHYREHSHAVCSAHFDPLCIQDNRSLLHPWAVPTLNLGLPRKSFIHQYELPVNYKSSAECIVWGCNQMKLPLYKFPASPEQSKQWFTNLKLEYTEFRAQTYRICRKHFENHFIDEFEQLKSGCLPTLLLNIHDNEDLTTTSNSLDIMYPLISSPEDLEDHDSSYYEDFEECINHEEEKN